jgi:hypothetical protein
MFDPYFIGEVDRKDVRVVNSFGGKQFQMLRVFLKLGDYYHTLILKPNIDKDRDQIVIDRLKHVFNLEPMHTFGLKLDFVYSNGVQYNSDWVEYFAFASTLNGEELLPVECLNDLSNEHKIQATMILLFRYIVGAIGNTFEHILFKGKTLMSISEGRFTTMEMCRDFASQFNDINTDTWVKARQRLLKGVLLDNIRGILLQIENPTNNINSKSPKGPLSIPARNIMVSIETRLDIIKTSELDELKKYLQVTN